VVKRPGRSARDPIIGFHRGRQRIRTRVLHRRPCRIIVSRMPAIVDHLVGADREEGGRDRSGPRPKQNDIKSPRSSGASFFPFSGQDFSKKRSSREQAQPRAWQRTISFPTSTGVSPMVVATARRTWRGLYGYRENGRRRSSSSPKLFARGYRARRPTSCRRRCIPFADRGNESLHALRPEYTARHLPRLSSPNGEPGAAGLAAQRSFGPPARCSATSGPQKGAAQRQFHQIDLEVLGAAPRPAARHRGDLGRGPTSSSGSTSSGPLRASRSISLRRSPKPSHGLPQGAGSTIISAHTAKLSEDSREAPAVAIRCAFLDSKDDGRQGDQPPGAPSFCRSSQRGEAANFFFKTVAGRASPPAGHFPSRSIPRWCAASITNTPHRLRVRERPILARRVPSWAEGAAMTG